MRPRLSFLFSLAVTVAAAWALWQTVGWPIKTALFPRAVGIPLLLVAAAEAILTLRSREPQALADVSAARTSKEVMDVVLAAEVPENLALRRTGATVLWLVGFLAAVLLVGFSRAIPLFVFGYLKGAGREGWARSLLLAAVAWGIFDVLFVRLLHLPFADGLLWRAVFK